MAARILDVSGNPLGGQNVVPLGIAIESAFKCEWVYLRTRPTRQPEGPKEVAFMQKMINEGMTNGYKLPIEVGKSIAGGLLKACMMAQAFIDERENNRTGMKIVPPPE